MGIEIGTTLTVGFNPSSYRTLKIILSESNALLFFNDSERCAKVKKDIEIINRDIMLTILKNHGYNLNRDAFIEITFSAEGIAKLDCLLQNYEMHFPFFVEESIRTQRVNLVYRDLHKAGYR
jgi:hypothetical protein